jgi:hypothetical protein
MNESFLRKKKQDCDENVPTARFENICDAEQNKNRKHVEADEWAIEGTSGVGENGPLQVRKKQKTDTGPVVPTLI